jgi:hypothetical protein
MWSKDHIISRYTLSVYPSAVTHWIYHWLPKRYSSSNVTHKIGDGGNVSRCARAKGVMKRGVRNLHDKRIKLQGFK